VGDLVQLDGRRAPNDQDGVLRRRENTGIRIQVKVPPSGAAALEKELEYQDLDGITVPDTAVPGLFEVGAAITIAVVFWGVYAVSELAKRR